MKFSIYNSNIDRDLNAVEEEIKYPSFDLHLPLNILTKQEIKHYRVPMKKIIKWGKNKLKNKIFELTVTKREIKYVTPKKTFIAVGYDVSIKCKNSP